MLAYMDRRTTIKLPEDIDREVREEAARRGMTISEYTRAALIAYLPRQRGHRQLRAAGAGRSGRSDLSERIEEILAAEWSEDRDRG